MQQSRLAAKKLTASTKSTPRELRPIPYDLIGPTALRAHTSDSLQRCRSYGCACMRGSQQYEQHVIAGVVSSFLSLCTLCASCDRDIASRASRAPRAPSCSLRRGSSPAAAQRITGRPKFAPSIILHGNLHRQSLSIFIFIFDRTSESFADFSGTVGAKVCFDSALQSSPANRVIEVARLASRIHKRGPSLCSFGCGCELSRK